MVNNFVRLFAGMPRSRSLVFSAAFLVAALALPGCKKAVTDPNDPKFVVAEKGTWVITREDLNKELADFLKQHGITAEQIGPSKMPMVETLTLKNIVLKKLLLEKAATEKPADADKQEKDEFDNIVSRVPPGAKIEDLLAKNGLTVDELKKQIHEKVLVENVIKTEAFKNVEPTDKEIDDIYLKNKDRFNIPPKVRASRVLVHLDPSATPAQKAAKKKIVDKARDRVVKGEDFGKVAGEVSEDQSSKSKGGDMGYFMKGENPDEGFDQVAFATKENAVSPVFLTPLGYQFIKVTSVQPAGVVPVADARTYISGRLRMQKMEAAAHDYTQKLLADSGVTYHLTLVDPPAEMAPGGGPGGQAPSAPDQEPPPAPAPSASTPPPAPAPAPASAPTPAPAPAPAKSK